MYIVFLLKEPILLLDCCTSILMVVFIFIIIIIIIIFYFLFLFFPTVVVGSASMLRRSVMLQNCIWKKILHSPICGSFSRVQRGTVIIAILLAVQMSRFESMKNKLWWPKVLPFVFMALILWMWNQYIVFVLVGNIYDNFICSCFK